MSAGGGAGAPHPSSAGVVPPRVLRPRELALIAGGFEAINDGLLVLDAMGEIVVANAAAIRDLGHGADELAGLHVGRVLRGLSQDDFASILERRRLIGTDNLLGTGIDVDAVRRDGSTYPVHLGVARFSHDGATYYLCTCQDTTQRREYRSLTAHLARHDRATGCLNRFGVEDHLDQVIEAVPESTVAVLYLDLHGLGGASESYPRGAEAGLVDQAVTRLRGMLREQDRLARVGRHEFVAVVVLDEELTSVGLITHRLLTGLKVPLEAAAWQVPVRASIGVSLYPEHARTSDKLIDRAEAAMLRAKRSAADEALLYGVEVQRRDEARDEYLERIRVAAEEHEFTLYFQPQFDLTTLQTTGLEALLRWQHPDEGAISPGDFLSLVSECGLMPTVSRWVLREAVNLNARLVAEGILDVPVAVNISPEIFEDRGFVGLVSQVLDAHGLAADRLEIEITEATAITDPAQVAANASALRALGVGIAIDDFGTGFSSLKRLRLVSFSKLKIDRMFVSLLPGDARDQTVIAGLLDLADGLDMQVVAEGIETEEQLHSLRMLGCRYGQGYWYGRPMPEDVLRAWLGRRR